MKETEGERERMELVRHNEKNGEQEGTPDKKSDSERHKCSELSRTNSFK